MDDARIRQIADEVLSALRAPGGDVPDLEARVSALERTVSALTVSSTPAVSAVAAAALPIASHPSLQLLAVSGGAGRCLLEPDKPCVQSGQCRQLGH